MTIYELFISTIKTSYMTLQKEGLIPEDSHYKQIKHDKYFQKLLRGEIRGFFNTIIQLNWEHIQGTDFEDHFKERFKNSKGCETVRVMKNDEVIECKIDHEQNECKVQAINNIINKNQWSDLLRDLKYKHDGKKLKDIDH
jgi:hypothetical protein